MATVNDNTMKGGQPQTSQTPGKDTAVSLIMVKCSCGVILKVRAEFAGKKIRCAKCGNILVAPMQSQLQESLLGKLQQKIGDLAKKLEEEQLIFRKSLEAKENEIKRLKEEFTEKENSWMNDNKQDRQEWGEKIAQFIDEELENLEKELVEEFLVWRGKMSKEQSTEQPGS